MSVALDESTMADTRKLTTQADKTECYENADLGDENALSETMAKHKADDDITDADAAQIELQRHHKVIDPTYYIDGIAFLSKVTVIPSESLSFLPAVTQ